MEAFEVNSDQEPSFRKKKNKKKKKQAKEVNAVATRETDTNPPLIIQKPVAGAIIIVDILTAQPIFRGRGETIPISDFEEQ